MEKVIVYDGIKFYLTKQGYYLGERTSTRKPERLHIYVWKKYNGEIPKGYHIHHKDENKANNDISNLEMIYGSTQLITTSRQGRQRRVATDNERESATQSY